jgi:transcriptional antiterminator RfaH
MDFHWYALRSKPRKEPVVCKQLSDKGIEVFFPQLRVNPVNPRARKFKPYFPGYLFVHLEFNLERAHEIHWMPFTMGLVAFGDEPAVVPDHLIVAIRHRVNEIAASGGEVFQDLKPGDPVSIDYGPFRGYEAIFDSRLSGNERVRVLLTWLDSRRVPVELNASALRPKKKPLTRE